MKIYEISLGTSQESVTGHGGQCMVLRNRMPERNSNFMGGEFFLAELVCEPANNNEVYGHAYLTQWRWDWHLKEPSLLWSQQWDGKHKLYTPQWTSASDYSIRPYYVDPPVLLVVEKSCYRDYFRLIQKYRESRAYFGDKSKMPDISTELLEDCFGPLEQELLKLISLS
jgi:hypothetical protein